ncbi:hypothetical protein G3I15_48720, partial [Streptomyces sp. SID10244]|nr:hypothetical protein [Streptomyces sp. SID10244]
VDLLGDLALDPSAAVGDRPLLTDREDGEVRRLSVGPDVAVRDTTLDTAIVEQSRRTPSAPALVFEDRSVDYTELVARVSS